MEHKSFISKITKPWHLLPLDGSRGRLLHTETMPLRKYMLLPTFQSRKCGKAVTLHRVMHFQKLLQPQIHAPIMSVPAQQMAQLQLHQLLFGWHARLNPLVRRQLPERTVRYI
jgi:hypothetical protein